MIKTTDAITLFFELDQNVAVFANEIEKRTLATAQSIKQEAEFEWPRLPDLPDQGFYALDRAWFSEHQMQGYANAYGEAVRIALTQATESVRRDAWQPIETAPKDGRMFLGWVSAVRYGESDEGAQFETDVSEHDFCRWHEQYGYFENMMGQIGDAYDVTHWMPLPTAPAALSDKKEGE